MPRPEFDDLEDSEPKYVFTELTDEERARLAARGIDPDQSLKLFLLEILTNKDYRPFYRRKR